MPIRSRTGTNFLHDVEFDQDRLAWQLPVFAFVPFFPLDPESTAPSAFKVQRMREAVPSIRLVLIENRFGGSVERIVP